MNYLPALCVACGQHEREPRSSRCQECSQPVTITNPKEKQ